MAGRDICWDDFITADDNADTAEPCTDEGIVNEVLGKSDFKETDDDDETLEPAPTSMPVANGYDLLVGLVFAWALLFPLAAVTVTVEAWLLARPWGGPLCAALLLLAYPAPPRWTPARGDTCLVVTTVAGIWAGEALLSTLLGAATPTPVNRGAGALYAVECPSLVGLAFIVARTAVGLLASVLVRTAVKAVIYPLLCSLHGCDPKLETSRQKGSIELPCKYITYLSMGITMSLGSPWLFRQLGIERDSLPVHL
ncbi:hypothetical protein HPB52_011367 [Rhipicephalus sanguineus]|uniref:Uncharacterized protein n=1 Tax=Rhipicephalus sanguineus TaxID=34632 RepID=A0A9D4PF72_RHISA|nr:hypothetical protein HPB52_011367 [Rhipicephalus sanguineus]